MRDYVLFHVNGREHRVRGDAAFETLSNYLRYDVRQTGTKIVCEEGDCGACTVLVRRDAGKPFRAVNSCILALAQLDGMSIVTVEGVRASTALHPVQSAMIEKHGAQCGYCTPGFICAMAALFETGDRVTEAEVRDGLTGNLCRCTGYEPIIKAALAVDGAGNERLSNRYPAVPSARDAVRIDAGRHFFAPTTLEEAIRFKCAHGPVTILQGGTDVGVWVNKRAYRSSGFLSLAKIEELNAITSDDAAITVGANVTLTDFEQVVRERIPQLFNILHVFGSPQIKNAGTLVGNIANGSPIGDTLPYLFVSGAELEIAGKSGRRTVRADSFYIGYKKFDLRPDEIIAGVRVPVIADPLLRLYKVSRRKDLDISAFTAAISLRRDGGTIGEARIAYGGVGPVVLRMARTEAFLSGKAASLQTFEEAGRVARDEIAPISDVRGSADYRLQLAENILSKYYYEAVKNLS